MEAECPTCCDIGWVIPAENAEDPNKPNFGKAVVCPDCRGATGGKDPTNYRLEKSDLGRVGKGKEFANFTPVSGTAEAYHAAKRFAEGDFQGFYFLVLLGGNGCGKTHLAVAAGRELIRRGANPKFRRSNELLLELKQAMRRDALEEELGSWKDCDTMILDDWGTEDATDWARSVVEDVLISRFEERRPTIITSNVREEAIADKEVGYPRLYSRFREKGRSKLIVMDAPDYRRGDSKEPGERHGGEVSFTIQKPYFEEKMKDLRQNGCFVEYRDAKDFWRRRLENLNLPARVTFLVGGKAHEFIAVEVEEIPKDEMPEKYRNAVEGDKVFAIQCVES